MAAGLPVPVAPPDRPHTALQNQPALFSPHPPTPFHLFLSADGHVMLPACARCPLHLLCYGGGYKSVTERKHVDFRGASSGRNVSTVQQAVTGTRTQVLCSSSV